MTETEPDAVLVPRPPRHPDTMPAEAPDDQPFAQRRARLSTRPQTHAWHQAMAMCELDERTDPTELCRKGRQEDAEAITALVRHLVFRIHQRAAWVLHGHPFEPPAESDRQLRPTIERVKVIFRKAVTAAFPPAFFGPAIDLRRFERTFAAFVAGELSMHRLAPIAGKDPIALHGVPNGATLFCFAEAVLLFLRLGIEARFWRPTLRSFTCGARFFAANYWTRKARRWAEYVPTTATRTSSDAILSMLDQYYRALDAQQLADEFGRTVAIALRDEPRLPCPVPTAPEFR